MHLCEDSGCPPGLCVRELGPDELRVLGRIADRLRIGQTRYGRLSIKEDRRNWSNEMLEELLDGTVYGALELIRNEE
jgi:hypothetical protein